MKKMAGPFWKVSVTSSPGSLLLAQRTITHGRHLSLDMDVEDRAAAIPLPASPPQDKSAFEHLPETPRILINGQQDSGDSSISVAPSNSAEDLEEVDLSPQISNDPQSNDQSHAQSIAAQPTNIGTQLETPQPEADLEASTALPPTPPSKQSELPEPPLAEDASSHTSRSSVSASSTLAHSRPPTPGTPVHRRSFTISKGHSVSIVLITSALETIASSKEAKRSANLRDCTQRALEMVRANHAGDSPREIFEPLRLACETRSEKLMIASLDCISKLISYSFFAEPDYPSHGLPSPPPSPTAPGAAGASQANLNPPSLVDLVTHTITACHSETSPETVSLQIVKALLSLVLSPTVLVHHSSLLKAIRTVYNVFLLSADPVNQMVAQGGLTQMVHHVFTRCKVSGSIRTSADFSPAPSVVSQDGLSSNGESLPTPEMTTWPSANGHVDDHDAQLKGERPPLESSGSLPLSPGNGVLNGHNHANGSNEGELQPRLTL